jgi:hypothetical protein
VCKGEGVGDWCVADEVSFSALDRRRHAAGSGEGRCVVFRCRGPFKTPGGRDVPPSRRYMDLLLSGAESAGLDPDYIAELRARPVAPAPLWLLRQIYQHRSVAHSWIARQAAARPRCRATRLLVSCEGACDALARALGCRFEGSALANLAYLAILPQAALGLLVRTLRSKFLTTLAGR